MQSDRPAPPYMHSRSKVQTLICTLLKERKMNKDLAAENAALKEQVTGNSTFPKLAAKDGAPAEGCSALESQLITDNEALVRENAALKEQATRNWQETVDTVLKKLAAEIPAVNDKGAENAALASVLKMKLWLHNRALKRQRTARNNCSEDKNMALAAITVLDDGSQ